MIGCIGRSDVKLGPSDHSREHAIQVQAILLNVHRGKGFVRYQFVDLQSIY